MSEGPRIYLLLPVHSRRLTTEKFIGQLLAQTYGNWHLVLIDDGSTDGTADMVRSLVSELTILRGQGQWWWAGALQQGYNWLKAQALAPSDLVLIANDDSSVEPDFLSNAVAAMQPDSLLLAMCYDMYSGELDAGLVWNWPTLSYTVLRESGQQANCFSTRGLFIRVADFLKIGGFHPLLLPHYLSDYEFTHRAWRKGYRLITVPEVFLKDDAQQTGVRDVKGLSLWRSLRLAVSIRSATNPFFWTSFVILACPLRHVPANILRVWRRFLIVTRRDLKARPV